MLSDSKHGRLEKNFGKSFILLKIDTNLVSPG